MSTTLAKGTVKKISVNRQALQKGEPAITVLNRGRTYPASDVHIAGPCAVRYNPGKPRQPRVWIETREEVDLV